MTEQVGWVPTRSGAVFAALHRPTCAPSGRAVVLVPPFGWEAMASARNLRGWARSMAGDGHSAVRFHLPGQGDSEGEAAAHDLQSWAQSLFDLVAHTRDATGCSRVTLVGLGLGGLVALQAVDRGCAADDAVLWATPVRGRLLLREIRAFAALVGEPGDGPPAAQAAAEVDAAGTLLVHGYPLGARAQQQLTELDATDLDLRRLRRALVLGRGTLPHDARLVAALAAQGVQAEGAVGRGYDELTVEPRLSQPPDETAVRVRDWLGADPPEPPCLDVLPWPQVDTDERVLAVGPASVVVRQVASPVLTAVFLGAGATPRSGPNRLWTEAARRWSEWGIASLRVDLLGLGEADGADAWTSGPEGFYVEDYWQQVHAVLDEVTRQGLPDRLLLVGLCSGGYWAAQAALRDDRVVSAALLNWASLVWPPPLAPLGPRERLRHLTRAKTWTPLLVERAARQDAWGRARRSLRLLADRRLGAPQQGSRRAPANSVQVLQALERKGVAVTVGLSPGEVSLPDVHALPGGGGTVVRFLEGPSGAHTLSTAGLRAQAEQLLDEVARAALSAHQGAER